MSRVFLPAASHDWALPFYDPFGKLMGAEPALRALLDQAAIRPTDRLLDIGCGTGTLAVLAKRLYPDVCIAGLDPDPKALARAQRKARRAAVSISFNRGFSDELPYRDACFDRVFSSFMFHHLAPDQKEKTLLEVHRALAPGGSFHLLDFERPTESRAGLLGRWTHSHAHFADNSEERILALLRDAGFASFRKMLARKMLLGILHAGYYQASR